jgi:DNA-nicking Smr family endonuclease
MAGRRLNPEERALWLRVAAEVRPLSPSSVGISKHVTSPPHVMSAEPVMPRVAPIAKMPVPVRALVRSAAPHAANTLDGSWDRRLSTGRIIPERTIDLHGFTMASAHHQLDAGLASAVADGVRIVLLVTGKAPARGTSRLDTPLRGIIRASVGDWLAASRHAGLIAAVRPAHPRHGGAGALYIILRRFRN